MDQGSVSCLDPGPHCRDWNIHGSPLELGSPDPYSNIVSRSTGGQEAAPSKAASPHLGRAAAGFGRQQSEHIV
jgi:hypothetical protein